MPFKGKGKEPWGKRTDDDLDIIAGKRDQLQARIQERQGVSKTRQKSSWRCSGNATPPIFSSVIERLASLLRFCASVKNPFSNRNHYEIEMNHPRNRSWTRPSGPSWRGLARRDG